MSYYHTRKTRKRYSNYPKPADCQFCNYQDREEPIVAETAHAYITPNRTFYDHWELRDVVDHLLVVPKRHVASLSQLDKVERAEIMDMLAEYEGKGYEVYARSPGSISRSVAHQHTHLIKTSGKARRGMLYLNKPYILWRFK